MPLYIRNAGTEALARKVAELKKVGLTEAIHSALENELKRESEEQKSLVETGLAFARRLQALKGPNGRPADKDFIDSLYE